ncbi:MAG: hypothetical protein ACU833_13165 [Gammaproteobacteria bacterium]
MNKFIPDFSLEGITDKILAITQRYREKRQLNQRIPNIHGLFQKYCAQIHIKPGGLASIDRVFYIQLK